MDGVLDLFRVLYEPGAVFERVKEKPRYLVPILGLCVLTIIVMLPMVPFFKMAMAGKIAEIAQSNPSSAATQESMIPYYPYFAPIGIFIGTMIGGGLLWLTLSLMGGEAKFKTLLSIATYSAITNVLLLAVSLLSLKMHPGMKISTMRDLGAPVGLDLLAPGSGPVLMAILAQINLFTIWGVALTAIGIEKALNTSAGTARAAAIMAFVIGLLFIAGRAALTGS